MARALLELSLADGLVSGISYESGRATCKYHLSGASESTFPTVQDIRDTVDDILGKVVNLNPFTTENSDPNGGKIRRKLPKCHPFLEMPAAGITSIAGSTGSQNATPFRPRSYGPASTSYVTRQFKNYSNYELQVEFQKRNYYMKADEFVGRGASLYYPPGATSSLVVYSAEEWTRFHWDTFTPLSDTLSTEYGQMRFNAPATGAPIDGAQFLGSPYVYAQNFMYECTWYQVPYRYFYDFTIDSVLYKSYLTRFVGCVNQNDWNGHAAGSLMYLGATPEPYTPPIQSVLRLPGFLGGTVFDTNQSRLCNVRLRFLKTTRTTDDPPNLSDTQFTSDKNIIPAGHNLQFDYRTRKAYCVHTFDGTSPATETDQTKWKPCFQSFPFELFYTDPLLKQPTVI